MKTGIKILQDFIIKNTQLFFFLILLRFPSFSQTFSWQIYADFQNAKGLEIVKNKVYCFTENGFFYYDKSDNQTVKLSKLDGFAELNIAQIRYSDNLKKLFVAYQSGNIDLVEIDDFGGITRIQNIDFIQKSTSIQGSKRIYQIQFQGDFAYFATAFGLVIFDVKKNEIKETYQNLGENGKELPISEIAFARDSIFLNTPSGIIGAKFGANINLQFYGNWKKVVDNQLFKLPIFPKNNLIVSPTEIEIDTQNKTWIADEQNGLVSNFDGNFKSYSPNGVQGKIYELFYQDNKIFALNGNFTQVLDNNLWKVEPNPPNFSSIYKDRFGYLWESTGFGLRVTNPQNSQSRFFGVGKNNGNLPSSTIYSIIEDRDGLIWLGTDNGVAVIVNSREIFTRNSDAYTPIYEGRRLLLQESVKTIAVDGGNRKWFGTPRGVSLFNTSADDLILNFTQKNSPLPADNIFDIEINQQTGDVFFATENGLVSYKSDAAQPTENFENISIFPNPIRPNYEGVLTVSGLTENSVIKITDSATKIIYETKSNGGIATWDLKDSKSNRITSGIYFVFMIDESGAEKLVGKFLSIN